MGRREAGDSLNMGEVMWLPEEVFRKATENDWQDIMNLVHKTVRKIYPHYYPLAVVEFFCTLHDERGIRQDIENENVWVLEHGGKVIATGSLGENRIERLYVLPEFQRKGHGTRIVWALEKEIAKNYKKASLEASLASCMLYEKMGYRTVRHEQMKLPDDVVFVWEVMERELR